MVMSWRRHEDNSYYFSGWRNHEYHNLHEDRLWQGNTLGKENMELPSERQLDWPHGRQRRWSSDVQRAWPNYYRQRVWTGDYRRGGSPMEWQRNREWDLRRQWARAPVPRDLADDGRRGHRHWMDDETHTSARRNITHNRNQSNSRDGGSEYGNQTPTKDRTGKNGSQRPTTSGTVYEDQRFGRDRHRVRYERVFVFVEYSSGRTGQSMCESIERELRSNFDDNVFLTTAKGIAGSFEVYINGKLLFSRLKNGGYPYEKDVTQAVDNVRHGRNFSELRHGQTRVCSIL